MFKGIKDRLTKELIAKMPININVNINDSISRRNSAWVGANIMTF